MSRNKSRRSHAKRRQPQILATVTALKDDLSVIYDAARNTVEFPDSQVDYVQQRVVYERKSGKEKVISTIPGQASTACFTTHEELSRNIDFLFAVDTNTLSIGGARTAICVAYHVPRALSTYASAFPFKAFTAFEIDRPTATVNAEVIGWHLVLRQIVSNPAYSEKHRIGIVVDSELDALPRLNSRELPVYAGEFLPANVRLIYASADTGGEALPNRMIAYCDRLATRIADYIRKNNIPPNTSKNGDDCFFGYRQIVLIDPADSAKRSQSRDC